MAQLAAAVSLNLSYRCLAGAAANPNILARLACLILPNRRLSAPPRLSSRTNSLRPPGLSPSSGDDESDSETPSKKSRNALKRDARRAVRWGMELAAFSAPQIKRVLNVASLDREVFDALMLVKRLGPDVREGRRRQFNYIGRLLRSVEPELMDALIQASKDGDNSRLSTLIGQDTLLIEDVVEDEDTILEEDEEGIDTYIKVATRWLDGLVYKDPIITNEVYSLDSVEFDRQELRKLVRKVQAIQEGQIDEENAHAKEALLNRTKKPLVRFLYSLAKKSLAE